MDDKIRRIKDLNLQSQCGIQLCTEAIKFEEEYEHKGATALGFLKAKTIAVRTPLLSFLERVVYFSERG